MSMRPDALQGLRALVVEDEILIAEELRDRLTRLGLGKIDVVDTGERAIQVAQQQQPQLILMDIRLKGRIDGIQAAEAIRHNLQAPVVFLTAHSDQETLQRAKQTDPFGYVLKPFNERELVVALEMSLHRHRLEQRLRESEHRYAATLDSIGDGVIATDAEGRITFLNPVAGALTQWSQLEAQSLPINQVFPVVLEASLHTRENPCLEAMRLHQIVKLSAATLLIARNGEMIPIDASAAPITDDKGKLLGAVVAFRDIRQRRLAEDALRQAEDQLRQAQKMDAIGRLAGGIAHDFNNLLTAINGFTEILLSGNQLDETSRSLLGEIKKAGDRAAGLTRQLLAFSRKQVLQPSVLDLGELINEISRILERLIGSDISISIRGVPGLWPIQADPSQIEQVILNLVVNARDAMPQGGQLMIETSNVMLTESLIQGRPETQPGRYVLLAVSDTGIGMDQATQERIFEPFFTTKEAGKGTGLGLATVYGIVKQSGGFIYLYSEPGVGSSFKLFFPALPSNIPITPPIQFTSDVYLHGSETILLVEDDPSVRALMSAALRRYGYSVHEAASGAEALVLFDEHHDAVDLVVTDIFMRGMTGRELAEQILASRANTRILFVSGYTDDAVVRHGILSGDMAFLQKPFTLSALAQKVRNQLDRPASGETGGAA